MRELEQERASARAGEARVGGVREEKERKSDGSEVGREDGFSTVSGKGRRKQRPTFRRVAELSSSEDENPYEALDSADTPPETQMGSPEVMVITPEGSEGEENMEDDAPSRVSGRKRPISNSPTKPAVNSRVVVDKGAQEEWQKSMKKLKKEFSKAGLSEAFVSIENYFNNTLYAVDPSYVSHRDQGRAFLTMKPEDIIEFTQEDNSSGQHKRRSSREVANRAPSSARAEPVSSSPTPGPGLSPEVASLVATKELAHKKKAKTAARRAKGPRKKQVGGASDTPPPGSSGRPPDSPVQRQSRLTDILGPCTPSTPSESLNPANTGTPPPR